MNNILLLLTGLILNRPKRSNATPRPVVVLALGSLVLVADPNGDGGAKRPALESSRQNLARVAFLARRDDLALTGTTAGEINLDVGFGQRDARRAAVNDHADAASVGLAPGGDLKEMAKGVRHEKSLEFFRQD